VKLLRNGQLKTYEGFPHGMATTHADVINADLLAFIRGEEVGVKSAEAPALVAEPIPVA
jgi:non-heme chloroperoxidase